MITLVCSQKSPTPNISVPSVLFRLDIFDSFLAGLVNNWVYGACFSAQTALKPVDQRRQQAQRAYCPNI